MTGPRWTGCWACPRWRGSSPASARGSSPPRIEPLRGVVQLNEPTDAQRAAAVRLVGRPKRTGTALRVDLGVVEEILRRGPWPAGLADAVETLTRPGGRPGGRAGAGGCRMGRGPRPLGAVDGPVPRARRVVGDLVRGRWAQTGRAGRGGPHRRDVGARGCRGPGDPGGRRARDAAGHRAAAGRPGREAVATPTPSTRPVRSAGSRPRWSGRRSCLVPPDGQCSTREVWAAAGVVLSNVASTVLCLGVPGWSGRHGQRR